MLEAFWLHPNPEKDPGHGGGTKVSSPLPSLSDWGRTDYNHSINFEFLLHHLWMVYEDAVKEGILRFYYSFKCYARVIYVGEGITDVWTENDL